MARGHGARTRWAAGGHQLDLDMPRLLDEALDEDTVVAERRRRLARRQREALRRLRVIPSDAHALATAAGRRLEHHGVADLVGDLDCLFLAREDAEEARDGAHPGRVGELLRLDLVAHCANGVRARTHESDALGLHGLGELGVLGEEAVARVNRLGTCLPNRVHDPVDAQVRVHRRGGAHAHRLVRHGHVRRPRVRLRVHGDGADAKTPRRADHAARDLATVGDQQLLEEPRHRGSSVHTPNSNPTSIISPDPTETQIPETGSNVAGSLVAHSQPSTP